jgi:PII-like signaling protein
MNAVCLRFYSLEKRKLHGLLVHDWLLDQARRLGLDGGTAFRASAGFGHHHRLHEDRFFELAGELPVEVEFITDDANADRLLALVKAEALAIYYVRFPVECGWTHEPPGAVG